jgi:phosphoribosylformylglycinamidine cyclo-ligase
MKNTSAYAAAGVDIDEMMTGLSAVKQMVARTRTRGVRSDIGSFGGVFDAPGRDHVLVSSTDGVGTKLKVASMAGRHDTVGQDLVNHCVNDILVQGAHPLFFLDYLGAAKLDGRVFREVVKGLCKACRQNGCALLGGETAEMPGLYPPGEYDLVGTIVGAVERKRVITGNRIRRGDVIIGLPSNGLHTNGYSLARRVIFDIAGLGLDDRVPGTRTSFGKALLAVHRSYLSPVTAVIKRFPIHGMAHITGGGLLDNVPRVLPDTLDAAVDTGAWPVPPLMRFIGNAGGVDREEMYRVFNMGIGYVLFIRPVHACHVLETLAKAGCRGRQIGTVVRGSRRVLLT